MRECDPRSEVVPDNIDAAVTREAKRLDKSVEILRRGRRIVAGQRFLALAKPTRINRVNGVAAKVSSSKLSKL